MIKSSYSNIEKINVSFQTIREMITDRKIEPNYLNRINSAELTILYENDKVFDIRITDEMSVIYIMDEIKNVKQKLAVMIKDTNKKNIIIVYLEKMTATDKKTITKYIEHGKSIEFEYFHINKLLFNCYKHQLVPPHEPITDEAEVKAVFDKYYITDETKHKFPYISHEDPIAKYLNIKSGTLVKIHNTSPTAGDYISYRICV